MKESELIDNYLRGELTEEEAKIFSEKMLYDETLEQRVSIRKLIVAGINASYTEELKLKLADFDKSLENKKRFQFSWKMAAVFAIVIVTISITYISVERPDPHDFDIDEPGLPNMMGVVSNVKFNNAMSSFKMNDFLTSGKMFSDLLKNDLKNDTLLYFSGICEFQTKNTEGAIQKWKEIKSSSVLSDKAQYRLAIAYWSLGKKNISIELLERIKSDPNSPYQEEAKKALSAIE